MCVLGDEDRETCPKTEVVDEIEILHTYGESIDQDGIESPTNDSSYQELMDIIAEIDRAVIV